jgi:hypothetical protein
MLMHDLMINASFLDEITDRRYPGFPVAEIAADGSSVITKHDGTGGLVSVGTVTALLLYEIAEPACLGPDVVTHFDTVRVEQAGPDRVALTRTRGSPPPDTLKVALSCRWVGCAAHAPATRAATPTSGSGLATSALTRGCAAS